MSLSDAVRNHDCQAALSLLNSGASVSGEWDIKQPLHLAADNGDVEMIKLLVDKGADVDARNRFDGCTVLGSAIQEGHYKATRCLLDRGADMNKECLSDWSVMRTAVHWGNPQIVETLLHRGASHSHRTRQGLQALHTAAANGHAEVVKLLLRHGADIDAQCYQAGSTPLMTALQRKHLSVASCLLDHRADISVRNQSGMLAIHFAAACGTANLVERLLDNNEADVTATTGHGRTVLGYAAAEGNLATLTALLDRGAGRELCDDTQSRRACINLLALAVDGDHVQAVKLLCERGLRPASSPGEIFHRAVINGSAEMVELLLKLGVFEVDVPAAHNTTALIFAATNGKDATMDVLLRYKASTSHMDELGGNALHRAVANASRRCIELLLSNGADINQSHGTNGLRALHMAVLAENLDMTRLLLMHGADVNAPSSTGIRWTPAIMCGKFTASVDILSVLLDHPGANVNAVDSEGRTALWFAAARGGADQAQHLLSRSPPAEANRKDRFGATPLIAAARNGHVEVVKHLLTLAGCVISLDDVDHFGFDASRWAAIKGDFSILELLRQHNAHTNPERPTIQFRGADEQTIVLNMPFNPSLNTCTVCERCIKDNIQVSVCNSCKFTKFIVCPDCRSRGALCRGGSNHAWEFQAV